MKYFFVYTLIFFLLLASRSHAASLSLETKHSVSVGETVPLTLVIDTQSESVNSFDVTVAFPSDHYSFSGYELSDTVPIFLVTTPTDKGNGTVHFAAVVPGGIERGYDPRDPKSHKFTLLTLKFVAHTPGESVFSIADATVLRNDGKGSAAHTSVSSAAVAVFGQGSVAASFAADTTPPEPFSIELIAPSKLGRTPQLLMFSTTDSESGVNRYEIRTGGKRFVDAASPYPFQRQLFPTTITVRAYDFAGNYQDAKLLVQGNTFLAVVIALVLAAGIVIYIVRTRKRAVRQRI